MWTKDAGKWTGHSVFDHLSYLILQLASLPTSDKFNQSIKKNMKLWIRSNCRALFHFFFQFSTESKCFLWPQLKHYWKAPLCCQHLPHPLPPLVHPNWHQISIVNTQGTARNEHRGLRPPANFLFQSQDDWMLAKVLHKPALSKPNRKANYCAT